ncbi:class I tRNA ligase family protein, partial [Candidatus Bipolaricaulota bacterium]|nr:class I tRNA ligase family protein [Candidatus Bipolaricaulota bacterium]
LLSNWYVRRSRRRFWKSESDDDKLAAHSTLHRCLVTVAGLLAPIAPFIPEEMYQNLVRRVDHNAPESVHLTDYPVANLDEIDETLNRYMELVMTLASLGRAARAKAGIKVRQPLAEAIIRVSGEEEERAISALGEHIKEEINVKGLRFVQTLSDDEPGVSIASDERNAVGIVTELTDELAAEGFARELVRRLQMMRRAAGFEISDHISVCFEGDIQFQDLLGGYADYIRQETLSVELKNAACPEGAHVEKLRLDGKDMVVGITKVA